MPRLKVAPAGMRCCSALAAGARWLGRPTALLLVLLALTPGRAPLAGASCCLAPLMLVPAGRAPGASATAPFLAAGGCCGAGGPRYCIGTSSGRASMMRLLLGALGALPLLLGCCWWCWRPSLAASSEGDSGRIGGDLGGAARGGGSHTRPGVPRALQSCSMPCCWGCPACKGLWSLRC